MSGNDLYVNYLTRAYSGLMESRLAEGSVKGIKGFYDYVNNGDKKTEGTEGTNAFSTENMTLEEYKQYIHMKISQIPMHPSQILRSVAIHITDEGFQAMQKDPKYEKWVMDTLKYDFGRYDPWANVCGGSFTIHYFGASKAEYHGESWYTGFQGGKGRALFETEAEESFWEKRAKRHKKYIKEQQEIHYQKEIMKRVYREAAIRRGDYENMFDKDGMAQCFNLANLLLMIDRTEK